MTRPVSGHDPTGWQYELQLALEDPALVAFENRGVPGPEAAAAAYRLALCLGYCRLLQVQLPDEIDGTLPAPEAMAAADELISHLSLWVQEARQLPLRWDTAPPHVKDRYCTELLQARMDAWAAYWAISEAHQDCVVGREPAAQDFGQVVDRLLDSLDRFDDALRQPEILALLPILAGSQLLDNWRQMLGIPNSDYLPWWLDGTLEQESRRIEAESLAAMQELQAHRRGPRLPKDIPCPMRRHRAAAILEVQIIEALAAEPGDEGPPVPVMLKWASPDGRWIARLSCPPRLAVGGHLPLEFLTPDDQPALELAGQPVRLAGRQATIGPQGLAGFDLQQLQAAIRETEPLTLEVGEEPREWPSI